MQDKRLLEAELLRQSKALIETGVHLQATHRLIEMEPWDDAVNAFLQAINKALADGQLHSPRLERSLKQLLALYLAVIKSFARLEDNKAAEAARLHQKRWAITG